MRQKTLYVSLNTNATPPVTIRKDSLSLGQHRFKLNWVPDQGQTGWVFADIKQPDKQTPLPDPPFDPPQITASRITVQDTNKASGDHGAFKYSICVKVGDTPYWSDPEIINRGEN